MKRLAVGVLGLVVMAQAARAVVAPDIVDYGRRCAIELGVELPAVDCLDAEATVLPVTRNGTAVSTVVESCDKPALLDGEKACIPGNRLKRISQRNARGEEVITMVLCRRSRGAAASLSAEGLMSNPAFNDVGVIQYNTVTRAACWFFMEDAVGKPSRRLPRPYSSSWRNGKREPEAREALAYWETPQVTAGGRCIKCHDAGPWLRSPFVAQARGTANAVPENPRLPTHHVEVGSLFRDWNGDAGPRLLRIHEPSYLATLAPATAARLQEALDRGDIAPLNTCTRCHALGSPPPGHSQALGTCGYLFDAAVQGTGTRVGVEEHHAVGWMPPRHGLSRADYRAYYGPAIAAARRCCRQPGLRSPGGDSACMAPAPRP